MAINGTSGNDNLSGTSGNDLFKLRQGGDDIANGLAGDDVFAMGGALTGLDRIDGGNGIDTVQLGGDYSAGIVFTATTIMNVERLVLSADHDYFLTFANPSSDANPQLLVDASELSPSDTLIIDASAEANFRFNIVGGAGNDTIQGGARSDRIDLSAGGDDTATSGPGLNTFYMGAEFSADDRIHGTYTGNKGDEIVLEGDYSIECEAETFEGIKFLRLRGAFDYEITVHDENSEFGMVIDARGIRGTAHGVIFDGSAETGDPFSLWGNEGSDTFMGGALRDVFWAFGGADTLTGGGGNDLFAFEGDDSRGLNFDTITDFHADQGDTFGVSVTNTKFFDEDTIIGGHLSAATFNSDLAALLDEAHLRLRHAVLFQPDSGDFAGSSFIILSTNGAAGYQADEDLVVNITGFTGQLSTANFEFHFFSL